MRVSISFFQVQRWLSPEGSFESTTVIPTGISAAEAVKRCRWNCAATVNRTVRIVATKRTAETSARPLDSSAIQELVYTRATSAMAFPTVRMEPTSVTAPENVNRTVSTNATATECASPERNSATEPETVRTVPTKPRRSASSKHRRKHVSGNSQLTHSDT